MHPFFSDRRPQQPGLVIVLAKVKTMPNPTNNEQQEIARLRESNLMKELLESRTVEIKHQAPSKGLASEGPFAFGAIEKIEFMAYKKKGAV